jgi:hypothetical protein
MSRGLWKTCAPIVETLWMRRHENKCWRDAGRKRVTKSLKNRASFPASLVSILHACESLSSPATGLNRWRAPPDVVNAHCFEEHIAGRTYRIEVLAVSSTRWRAQIARLPGMPTALMPFYGRTPEEAAQELSRWLALVYNGVTAQ